MQLPLVAFGSRNLRLKSPFQSGTDVLEPQTVYDEVLRIMPPPQGPMGSPITRESVVGPQTMHQMGLHNSRAAPGPAPVPPVEQDRRRPRRR